MTDFQGLLRLLVDGGVEFIVVGGVAATVHGSARLTQDLDVVYSRRPSNVRRLVRALGAHRPYLRGAPHGLPFRWDEATVTTDLGDLDLLGEVAGGGGYEALLPETIMLELFGMTCRCLGLESLIRVKRAAGRRRDLETVAELEALLEERDASEH